MKISPLHLSLFASAAPAPPRHLPQGSATARRCCARGSAARLLPGTAKTQGKNEKKQRFWSCSSQQSGENIWKKKRLFIGVSSQKAWILGSLELGLVPRHPAVHQIPLEARLVRPLGECSSIASIWSTNSFDSSEPEVAKSRSSKRFLDVSKE